MSVHGSLYNIAKWFSYHACKCDLNWNIIMRSGYIRLVRVRQLLYWNCQCEQIIFEVRSNISLSVGFVCQFLLQMLLWIRENRQEFLLNYTEIGNDTTSAEELEDEHQNFQSSCMVSEFNFQQSTWKIIIFQWNIVELCVQNMPKGYSALVVFKSLSGCTDLHLRKSHPLFSIRDLKMLFFRLV